MKLYSQKDVSRITGISPNTIQLWVKNGLVRLSVTQNISQGIARMYSASDVVHFAIIKVLSDHAFNRNLIKSCSAYLQTIDKTTGKPLKDIHLDPDAIGKNDLYTLEFRDNEWTVGQRNRVTNAPRETLNKILRGSQTLIIIDVGKVVEKLRPKL